MNKHSASSGVVLIDEPIVGILHIRLHRPAARNAVNDELAGSLATALAAFDEDDLLRVAVLSGTNGFCAGMDLKALLANETGTHASAGFGGIVRRPPVKPIVAAVEGFALAGGFEIALACDLIVAAADARFGLPEVRHGLVADDGGLTRLPRRLPRNIAMELALTGRDISASRLYELGLVNVVTAPGSALDEALTLASAIAAHPPLPVRIAKQVIRESREWTSDEEWDRQAELTGPVWESQDATEGASAFTGKRRPDFGSK